MQLTQHLGHRHFGTCHKTSRITHRIAAAKEGSAAAEVKAARLSRILRQYGGGGGDGDEETTQKDELQQYMAQRNERMAQGTLRASSGNSAANERELARLDMYMPMGPDGMRQANYGLHGEGQMHWWALRVKGGREKQVAEALERLAGEGMLPPLEPVGQGSSAPESRIIETWTPKKSLKVWNPKTEKMGSKALRYPAAYPAVLIGGENGGWVLVRAVLDSHLYNRIRGNPSFIGWEHVDSFVLHSELSTDTRQLQFPRPCPQQVVEEVKEWELDLVPVEEAAVRAALDMPAATAEPAWEEPEVQVDEKRGAWEGGERSGGRGERRGGRGEFAACGRGRGRGEAGRGRGGRGSGTVGSYADRDGGDRDSWFEGGGGRRERQGAGLYAAADGGNGGGGWEGQQQEWQQQERGGRGGRGGGGFEERGGRGGRNFDSRPTGGSYESRGEGRQPDFGQEQGGRDGDSSDSRRFDSSRWQPRNEGSDRRNAPGNGSGNKQGSSSSQGGWFEGPSKREEASDSGSVWDTADDFVPLVNRSSSGADDGGFSGWFDDAAAGFDFDAPAPAAAAAAGASSAPAAATGGWSWEEVLGQQQEAPPPMPAQQPAQRAQQRQQQDEADLGLPDWAAPVDDPQQWAAPAVDAGGMWDEQPGGDLGLGLGLGGALAAGGAESVAYGIPGPPQQSKGEWRERRSEGRGGGGGGRGRFGSGGREGAGGERSSGGRGARERYGDRGNDRGNDRGSGRFDSRSSGGRGERSDRRSSSDGGGGGGSGGGWYEGSRSNEGTGAAAASFAKEDVDLSWWDGDAVTNDEGAGFTGVYPGSDNWEGDNNSSANASASGAKASTGGGSSNWGSQGGNRSERRSEGRNGGGGGSSSDSGWGQAEAQPSPPPPASAADVAAAAAFQPGQQVAVTQGSFQDFGGVVVSAQGGRLTAELDIFGKRTRVELSPSDVSTAGTDGGSGAEQ